MGTARINLARRAAIRKMMTTARASIAFLALTTFLCCVFPAHAQTDEIIGPVLECSDSPQPELISDWISNYAYDIGGYVKLDAIFDFDDAGNRFQFLPREIAMDGGDGPTTTFHARQLFLNLAVTRPTAHGDVDLFVEGDFFGAGNTFRLRHAYGRWGNWLAGQTWSQLVDEDGFIETLDFAGADSGTLLRTAQLRFTHPFSESILWRIGIEENVADVLGPTVAGQIRNRFPALASGVRLGTVENHLYCLGAIADATFVPDVGPDQTETVWALGLSSRFSIGPDDSLISRFIGGDGANSLITDNTLSPTGLSAPAGQIIALREFTWSIAYLHYWRDDLRSNLVYRQAKASSLPSQSGSELQAIQYAAGNLIWTPVEFIDIGVEYLFGQRQNIDNARSDASRLQFSIIWRLP